MPPADSIALRRLGLIILCFAALTMVMTWPLLPQVDRSVIGWVGDNFYFIWLFEWLQHSLLALQSPLAVPQINYPEGWHLGYNESTPAMVLLGLPAAFAGGSTLGYNTALLFSFVLSGLGVTLWSYRLTRCLAAGLVAGFLFAFAPYRMTHILGHLNLMGTHWLPFYFLTLSRMAGGPRCCWRRAALPALFLGLTGLSSLYYLMMALVLTVVYGVGYLLWVDGRAARRAEWWGRWAAMAALTLPLALIAVWPSLSLRRLGILPPHDLDAVRFGSASPTDFVLPSVEHFLWGRWIAEQTERANWVESTLYVGVVTLGCALLAVAVYRRLHRQGPAGRGIVPWLASMAAVSFVLALGTDLHWFDIPVPAPWAAEPSPLWLPGYWLYRVVPFYANMRVWMRYGVFVSLFLSVLAGIGLAWWLRQMRARQVWLVAGLVLAVAFVDYYPGPYRLSPVRGRPVDAWLAQQPGDGAIAQFPLVHFGLPEHLYYTTLHGKPYAGAFFGAYATPQYYRLYPQLSRFPDPSSLAALRELGVRWLLIEGRGNDAVAQQVAALEAQGMALAYEADNFYVFIWPDEAGEAHTPQPQR